MIQPNVLLTACLLLATSLSFAVVSDAFVEHGLNGQVVPRPWSGNIDSNRPFSMCVSSFSSSPSSVVQRNSLSGSTAKAGPGTGHCPVNFSLSLSQQSLTLVQGSSGQVHVLVTLLSGTSASVTVSARGVPAATEILFTPALGRPSFLSAMAITTSAGTPLGQFSIIILANGAGLEKSALLSLLVVPIIHNIAIVSASAENTAVIGSVVLINATIANYGSVSEDFELRAYANNTLVADQLVFKLAPSAIYAGRLIWNTTGYPPGTYSIMVVMAQVQGELNFLKNTRDVGRILLTQTSGSGPVPSPAGPGEVGHGFTYARQLAIVAAIAEAFLVFFIFLRGKGKDLARKGSGRSRRI